MATISSPGIGSGLDVNSIITQLMAIEKQPLTKLQTAASTIQTQISEVGKLKSSLSTFRDLATKIVSTDFWKQSKGSASTAEVGITTGVNATPGDYSVEVTSLAATQSIATGFFASSSAALSAGTLHIELGRYGTGQTTFTPKTGVTALDVAVDTGDTLASTRDKINAAGAGVTASILTDANGARLLLRSNASGEENAFRTSVTPGGGALAALAFDPSSGVNAGAQTQAAANAAATINGLAVSSASNTLADVMDGVTLTLKAQTAAPVTVSVTNDTDAMKETLQKFASAYSDLAKLIATDTRYDATTKKAGPLQADSAVIGLQNRLRGLIGASSTVSSAFPRLSDAGFELQRDGTLTVNDTRLNNALANLGQLKLAFSNSTPGDASLDGFARKLRTAADDLLGIDGALTNRTDGLNQKLDRNKDSQDRLQTRLAQTQKRLEAQYTALDAKLGALNGINAYVTQQVTAWNKNG
jgi:flagellar hook-associated protein 2